MTAKITHDGDVNFANNGDIYGCVQCGKKVGKSPLWVCIYNGGQVFAKSAGTPERDGGYMGFYPVGSTCANQFAQGVLWDLPSLTAEGSAA